MKQCPRNQVIKFRSRSECSELERINRLTGLEFSSLPTSLLLDSRSIPQDLPSSAYKSMACND